MILQQEKLLHWAEAFGLSAAVHVGVAYFVLTSVVDLTQVFDRADQTTPSLQITSLAVETSRLMNPDIGAGANTQTIPDTLAPLAEDAPPAAPVAQGEATAQTPAQPERIAPVTPTPVTAPEVLSPLRPATPTLAPVAAASDQPPAPDPLDPVPSDTSPETPSVTLDPVTPDLDTGQDDTAPAPSEAAPPATDADPDPLAADLIERIRAAVGEACLIALPRQSADGAISLQILTATEDAAAPFADEILAGLTPRPPQDIILIDPRQCAALDYIRQGVAYPSSPLSVELDVTQIPSGTDLTGRINNTGGRNVTLVLVDDNGVVQDLGGYLNVAVNTARFAAPLRRFGNVRDTRQLLIALGTGARLATVTDRNGQTADVFFDSLQTEIAGNAAIALVPFEVR